LHQGWDQDICRDHFIEILKTDLNEQLCLLYGPNVTTENHKQKPLLSAENVLKVIFDKILNSFGGPIINGCNCDNKGPFPCIGLIHKLKEECMLVNFLVKLIDYCDCNCRYKLIMPRIMVVKTHQFYPPDYNFDLSITTNLEYKTIAIIFWNGNSEEYNTEACYHYMIHLVSSGLWYEHDGLRCNGQYHLINMETVIASSFRPIFYILVSNGNLTLGPVEVESDSELPKIRVYKTQEESLNLFFPHNQYSSFPNNTL